MQKNKKSRGAGDARPCSSARCSASADDDVAVEGEVENAARIAASFGMENGALQRGQQKIHVFAPGRNQDLADLLAAIGQNQVDFSGLAHVNRLDVDVAEILRNLHDDLHHRLQGRQHHAALQAPVRNSEDHGQRPAGRHRFGARNHDTILIDHPPALRIRQHGARNPFNDPELQRIGQDPRHLAVFDARNSGKPLAQLPRINLEEVVAEPDAEPRGELRRPVLPVPLGLHDHFAQLEPRIRGEQRAAQRDQPENQRGGSSHQDEKHNESAQQFLIVAAHVRRVLDRQFLGPRRFFRHRRPNRTVIILNPNRPPKRRETK